MMNLRPRLLVAVCLWWVFLGSAFGHGNPSVAALISRDPGEPLVAKLNLDLTVFFKGRVEPNQAWVEKQSPEDLELLKGDLDKFLRKLYDFSVPGTYSFPLLGKGGERVLAPGISLPDGHVMPVFTSDTPPGDAVSVSSSGEAAPLVIVKEIDGKRSRRSVILFPGEEREIYPALVLPEDDPVVVDVEVEEGLDASLFAEDERFVGRPWKLDLKVGWDRVISGGGIGCWILMFALGCQVRSRKSFYAIALGILGLGLVGGAIFANLLSLEWAPSVAPLAAALVISVVGVLFKGGWRWFGGVVVFVGIEAASSVIVEGDLGTRALGALGVGAGFAVVALVTHALMGWLWRDEKTPRALAQWGGGISAVAVVAAALWLRSS